MKVQWRNPSRLVAFGLMFVTVLALVAACAGPAPTPTPVPPKAAAPAQPAAAQPAAQPVAAQPTAKPAAPAQEAFDLDALVKAAQKEGELTVYSTSSRVTTATANFEKKYGIKAKGTKMADPEQAERVIREVDSKNVQVDVINFEDGALLASKLIPEGYVVSWMPPDLMSVIPAADQNPLVYQWQPRMIGYNTDSYPSGCPVKNVWEFTEAKWKGKLIVRDPGLTPANLAWFASLVSDPKELEQAYKDLYGKPLETKEKNAGWEFLKRLAQNVAVMKADGDIGDAVGAAGQKDAPLGMYTLTKHRDNKDKNLKLATCKGLQPWMGYALPTYALTVKNSPHPNAAKLFIHYLLTPEGIAPWTVDDMGGFSPNPEAKVNPNNEGTWAEWQAKLDRLDLKAAVSLRQDVQDFWLQYNSQK